MMAAKGGHLEIVKKLVLNDATCRLKSDGNKSANDYTTNSAITQVLNKASMFAISRQIEPSLKRQQTKMILVTTSINTET